MIFKVYNTRLNLFLKYSECWKYRWEKGEGKIWKRKSDLMQTINARPEVFSDPDIIIIQYDLKEISRQTPSEWRK